MTTILECMLHVCMMKNGFLGSLFRCLLQIKIIIIKFKNMDTNSFSWPVRDDICWIPVANVLCRIATLSVQNGGGRLYSIFFEEYKCIINVFSKH